MVEFSIFYNLDYEGSKPKGELFESNDINHDGVLDLAEFTHLFCHENGEGGGNDGGDTLHGGDSLDGGDNLEGGDRLDGGGNIDDGDTEPHRGRSPHCAAAARGYFNHYDTRN